MTEMDIKHSLSYQLAWLEPRHEQLFLQLVSFFYQGDQRGRSAGEYIPLRLLPPLMSV